MPIRARVQRLWRLVVEWWRPSARRPSQPPASQPHAAPPPQPRLRIASRHPAKAPAAPHVGKPLVGGAVTLRMWVVAGRVVLATSEAEAERALVTLLGELAPDEQPELAVVLCHGFGATGRDLVGLVQPLAIIDPDLVRRSVFLFPAGPLDLSGYGIPYGRAWWMIDLERLERELAASRPAGRAARVARTPPCPARMSSAAA